MELGPGNEHVVQFYGEDDRGLIVTVAQYLAEALVDGGAAIIIAQTGHREALLRSLSERLPTDDRALAERIVAVDGGASLGAFMVGGRPDPELFDATIGKCVRVMCERYERVRAYGEMVGCLWQERAFDAATRLEALWKDLLERHEFGLFCGYPIDVLGDEFQIGSVRSILSAHTQLLPSLSPDFGVALSAAMNDVLGASCHGLRGIAQQGFLDLASALPPAEATILRLRHSLPRYADEILSKTRRNDQPSA